MRFVWGGRSSTGRDSGGFQSCGAASATQCAIWGWTRISASGALSVLLVLVGARSVPCALARRGCALVVGPAASSKQGSRRGRGSGQWWPRSLGYGWQCFHVQPPPVPSRWRAFSELAWFWNSGPSKRRAADSPPTRTHEAVPGGVDFVQGGTQRIEQGSAGAVGGEDIRAGAGTRTGRHILPCVPAAAVFVVQVQIDVTSVFFRLAPLAVPITVTTSAGQVQGSVDGDGVSSFRGIPY